MKPAVFALIGLFGFSVWMPCRAQDTPHLNLPCDQVVRMGLTKFQKRFSDVTHDDSTAGMVAACTQYYHCRRRINDTHVRALPARRQEQVRRIREALDALDAADSSYGRMKTGGGTMWAIIDADTQAEREDFLALLIADLGRPAPSSRAARWEAESRLRTARKRLASLGPLKTPKNIVPPMNPDELKDYKRTYAQAVSAFARLQALTRALPDVSARRVAREAAHVLALPAE